MDETRGIDVDDEYFDNHDDEDTGYDIDDCSDDDHDHKKHGYAAAGAAPDAGAAPGSRSMEGGLHIARENFKT